MCTIQTRIHTHLCHMADRWKAYVPIHMCVRMSLVPDAWMWSAYVSTKSKIAHHCPRLYSLLTLSLIICILSYHITLGGRRRAAANVTRRRVGLCQRFCLRACEFTSHEQEQHSPTIAAAAGAVSRSILYLLAYMRGKGIGAIFFVWILNLFPKTCIVEIFLFVNSSKSY